MEIKDISYGEKGLFEVEEDEKPWNTSGGLEKIGKEKVESLKEEIKEIEELINERERLSKEVFQEAEKVKMEINNFLAETRPMATDLESARDRVMLKQKQVEISELQLKEKISCWQDVAKLKEGLRECKKELTNREERIDMLGKILED